MPASGATSGVIESPDIGTTRFKVTSAPLLAWNGRLPPYMLCEELRIVRRQICQVDRQRREDWADGPVWRARPARVSDVDRPLLGPT